jgi:hypothetical protein
LLYAGAYVAIERIVEPDDLKFVIDLLKRRRPGRQRATETV